MPRSHRNSGQTGFTLIELMIVVVVIGLLVAVGLPNFQRMTRNAKIARTATEMKTLSVAFLAYRVAYDAWPPDSHLTLPPGMESFINPQIWADGTPLGGGYNWDGPDFYGYAGLSVFPADAIPAEDQKVLDNMLDDGNLGQGRFRVGNNGRPTYIIEE